MQSRPQHKSYPHQMAQDRREQGRWQKPAQNKVITSHAAGAFAIKVNAGEQVDCLLVPYEERLPGRPTTKKMRIVMETQEPYVLGGPKESPTDSLIRGIGEEIIEKREDGKTPQPFSWDFWPRMPTVLARLNNCEKYGGLHLKIFRMITINRGPLRTIPIVEVESRLVPQGVDVDQIVDQRVEITGAPVWCDIAEALRLLGQSKPIHFEAAKMALWSLVNENPQLPKIARRYAQVVDNYCGEAAVPIKVRKEEEAMIKKYVLHFPN